MLGLQVLYENITADEVGNAVWIDMQYFSTATHCSATSISIWTVLIPKKTTHGP